MEYHFEAERPPASAGLPLDSLAYVPGDVSMTIIESHYTEPPGLVNHARSPGFMPADLAKASIVHIATSDSMTSIIQQCTKFGSCMVFPSSKSN